MASIEIHGLNAGAEKALQHAFRWLARMTGQKKLQGRFEIVAGEGRIKVWHETNTYRPEDAPD